MVLRCQEMEQSTIKRQEEEKMQPNMHVNNAGFKWSHHLDSGGLVVFSTLSKALSKRNCCSWTAGLSNLNRARDVLPLEIHNYVQQAAPFSKYKHSVALGWELETEQSSLLIYTRFKALSAPQRKLSRSNAEQMMDNVSNSWSGSF